MLDFDKMTTEEIHGIERAKENYAQISKKICGYFCESSRYSGEEEYKEIMIEAEEYKNPYAVKRIAEYYRDGLFVEQSDEEYIHKLEQFVEMIGGENHIRIAWNLIEENFNGRQMGELGVDDWIRLDDMGGACKYLGLYYSGISGERAFSAAQHYLRIALGCHYDVGDEYVGFRPGEPDIQGAKKHISNIIQDPGLKINGLYYEGIEALKLSFGEIWDRLSDETQKHLQTAIFTYSVFNKCGEEVSSELDFSCIISLLTRALEYEMDKFFFKGYISYLKQNFGSAEEYLVRNGISHFKWKNRNAVLEMDNDKHLRFVYANERHFSLGILNILTGFEDDRDIGQVKIDRTFLDYALQGTRLDSERDIKKWVDGLISDVERIRHKRNKASHGGTVFHTVDAEYVFDQIVWIRKILVELKKQLPI